MSGRAHSKGNTVGKVKGGAPPQDVAVPLSKVVKPGDPSPGEALAELRARYRTHLEALGGDPTHSVRFDFARVFPETRDIQALVAQVDDLKRCLESFRPLNPAQAANLQAAFDIEYTYDSNRIEGNTLTLLETHLVVSKGVTIGGKRLEEHLEAVNHKEAIDFIRDLASRNEDLSEYNLKCVHGLILRGIDTANAGTYRSVPVHIAGTTYVPPQPYMIPKLMEDLFRFYEANRRGMHPVLLASEMHERLATIHPFIDGNGRASRLVMNLVLLGNGFPIASVSGSPEGREGYYNALQTKQTGGTLDDFHRVVLGCVRDSFFRYLAALAGGIGPEEETKGAYFFGRIKEAL